MKQKNLTLQKKLGQYSLLMAPVFATTLIADAQVMYHDIDPDILYKDSIMGDSYTTPYFLDLDGDGSYDVKFAVWSSVQSNNGPNRVNLAAARQLGAVGNAIMGYTNLFSATFCSTVLPLYCPSALNVNKSIESSANFWAIPGTTNLGTLVRYFKDIAPPDNFVGQWNDVTDKYFGLRFHGGDGDLHYGWIRMDVFKSPASIILKDYAYEKQDGISIRAGDDGNIGISSEISSVKISILNIENGVNILMNDGGLENATVNVTSMLGQMILTQVLKSSFTHLDLNQFTKGIYLVTVNKGDEMVSKKIIIS